MVKLKEKVTEKKILNAAKKIFLEKGRDGARMQEIADEAGINKSLLHYYFRSKDKLYEAIFEQEFGNFLPNLKSIITSDDLFSEKVRLVVSKYFELIKKNPFLPLFILDEISRNPDSMKISMIGRFADPGLAMKILSDAKKEGYTFKEDPRHFLVNFIGLSVMPFLGRNAFEKILFGSDHAAYDEFLEERKKVVADVLLNQMKNDD